MTHPEMPPAFLGSVAALLLACAAGALAAPLDYSQLTLRGNGHVQDHFSLAVQAAARLLGRDLDYETLYVLSGNAFAPCVDPGESCTSWWMTATGRDVSVDLVARRLGLQFRRLATPGRAAAPPMPPAGPAREAWMRDYWRKPAVPLIREAQARGEVVLTGREWPVRGPHGFMPWCWWGVIVSAADDGTILGAGLNGFRDNPLDGVDDMLALSLGAPALSPEQADFEVLCRAVSRIHGNATPYHPGARTVYGLAAVDRWIERMGQVPFCADCKEQSASCAHDTARPMLEGAQVAARYLRRLAAGATSGAQGHLAAAAGCYERIAALLRPAVRGDGGEAYAAFIGDLGKQQAHVAEVLRPARTALAQAAEEMAAALAATAPKTVSLSDIPPGQGDGNGCGRGLQVLLAREGVAADYDTLMGDLGLAFITQASDQAAHYDGAVDVGWWPLEPACSRAYLPFVSQVVGRRLEAWDGLASWQPNLAKNEDVIAQVRVAHTLAAGRPVLVNHDFWKVVTATDQDPQPLLGFCPCTPKTTPERLPGPAWEFVAVGEPVPQLDRKEADLEALRHAVALGRDHVAMPGGYVTGQKAYALWAAALRDLAHLGQARWHSNMVLHLGLNRHSAPVYLEQMAARHPGARATHLLAAAELYRQSLRCLATADTSQAAMTSPAGRETLARLVEEMAALEARAVGELEAALAAAG
ncbi:hypothetical protein LLH23_17505 [bacterium]|nr:hypothetical protein [bacterium]